MAYAEFGGSGLVRVSLGGAQPEDLAIQVAKGADLGGDARRECRGDHLLLQVHAAGQRFIDSIRGVRSLTSLLTNSIRRLEAADRRKPRQERISD